MACSMLLQTIEICSTGVHRQVLYRCIVKNGHAGSGQHVERTIMVRAKSVLDAMNKAKRTPGVKKGHLMRNGGSVLRVERAEG